MNIEDLTYGQMKEINKLLTPKEEDRAHPYKIGQNYFIRTVTHYFVGNLLGVFKNELVMNRCSWVADTGRFHDAIVGDATFSEIEPYKATTEVIINRGAIIDASFYASEIPVSQK